MHSLEIPTTGQPRLNVAAAKSVLSDYLSAAKTEGQYIHSATNLLLAEQIREKFSLCDGRAVPVDVCLPGWAGPETGGDWTRVGGLPHWDRRRPWPKDPDGRPMLFLAQF